MGQLVRVADGSNGMCLEGFRTGSSESYLGWYVSTSLCY